MQGNEFVKYPGDAGYIVPGSDAHHKVIGCSMVGDILGVGYKSPMERWMELTGRGGKQAHKRIFDRGHAMEDHIVAMMESDFGRSVSNRQVQFCDPRRPWLVCHADGIIAEYTPLPGGAHQGFSGVGLFESKAPGSHMVRDYREAGLPGGYVAQGQLGMHVAGSALGAVVDWSCYAFLDYDSWETVPFDVPRSAKYIEGALSILDYFWSCVQSDTPPNDLPIPDVAELPMVSGEVELVLNPEKINAFEAFISAAMVRKEADQFYDEAKAAIKEVLGYGKFQAQHSGKVNILPRAGKRTLKASALAAYCATLCQQQGIEFNEELFANYGKPYDDIRAYPSKEMTG